jgi:four helix bundle protein
MAVTSRKAAHRDSPAWQKGMQLTAEIYRLTKNFPSDERFGLTNQLRRAAVSVPSNIAEGKGRLTRGEMIHFFGIARGSAMEVQTQLEIAEMIGEGRQTDIDMAFELAAEVIRILNASISTMRERAGTKQ